MQNNPFGKPETFASVLRCLTWIILTDPILVGAFLIVLGLLCCHAFS